MVGGVVLESDDLAQLNGKKLLLGLTGALQCLSIGDLLFACKTAGVARIGIVLSPTAAKMSATFSLQCVADEVITHVRPEYNHIQMSRLYDRLIVAPATAHFLSQAATGATGNTVELLHLSMPGPSIIAPTMNSVMWRSAAVQRNIKTLSTDGNLIVDPIEREVYEGASRTLKREISMASIDAILHVTARSFKNEER